jgi:ABC-type branched-subunit amino acid transport system ATPase component
MNFITLKNITKSFNGVDVLKDINLTIDEGETLGILGRSGSGKSVLINMLRGTLDYKPDSGKVLMNVAVCPNCLTIEPPSKDGEKCIATTSFRNIDPECEIAKVWTTLVKDVLPSMFEEYWGYIPYIEADNAEDIHQQLEKISEKRGDIHHFVKLTEERAA